MDYPEQVMSSLKLSLPMNPTLVPKITVLGVGGAGCNAINNMIESGLIGVNFVVANTDVQSLDCSLAGKKIQLGIELTKGLGAGSSPDVGKAAAEESISDIMEHIVDSNILFITAGMGGGTGTGASPVIARLAREKDILTIAIVTTPFNFEGNHRYSLATQGIEELKRYVDTYIVVHNQNLFRIVNANTTLAEAFKMADDFLLERICAISDLMIKPALINLDFADVKAVVSNCGKAVMGTGEAFGEDRAVRAAEDAISNPLLDNVSVKGARNLLINISGGNDLTLFEVDAAVMRIREEVGDNANIIFGSTFNDALGGSVKVSVMATGIDLPAEIKCTNQNEVISGYGINSGEVGVELELMNASSCLHRVDMRSFGGTVGNKEGGLDSLDIPAFLRRKKQ